MTLKTVMVQNKKGKHRSFRPVIMPEIDQKITRFHEQRILSTLEKSLADGIDRVSSARSLSPSNRMYYSPHVAAVQFQRDDWSRSRGGGLGGLSAGSVGLGSEGEGAGEDSYPGGGGTREAGVGPDAPLENKCTSVPNTVQFQIMVWNVRIL